ncbi:hypothetical protein AX17_002629 [Amanita inopinata Kibby_2008]|nr:hypothetical protein AX17_002629 [Amanita inopinata Kibby_2008]
MSSHLRLPRLATATKFALDILTPQMRSYNVYRHAMQTEVRATRLTALEPTAAEPMLDGALEVGDVRVIDEAAPHGFLIAVAAFHDFVAAFPAADEGVAVLSQ